MQILLLAVIMRQLAIICIALMMYGIYRLWDPKVTPLHLKPLTISISITTLIIIIVSLAVKWFTNPLDYLSDDFILYMLHSKAELVTGEMLIAFTVLCYGLSLINFKNVFNSKIKTKKLALFTLFFVSITGTIGFTAYKQQVQLTSQQQGSVQPDFNTQFFTDTVTERTETTLYTNNQDVTVSLVTNDDTFDVSKPTTYKELLPFLSTSRIQLSKGTVVQELNTKYPNVSKETSGLLEKLTKSERNNLPLQVKVINVSLIKETITTTLNVRPSLVYHTTEKQYFHIEYEIINLDEINSMRDSKDKDQESIDNVLKGSDKHDSKY
jgi:hypothetical protein